VGSRASLDTVVRRKILSPYRDSKPPIIQPAAQRYTAELSRLQLYLIPCLKFPKFCSDHNRKMGKYGNKDKMSGTKSKEGKFRHIEVANY
jgi:hypothetical protein